ncbi:hypothetical protein HDU86_005495 [Geranomyces michiganensis]|nr:hypothetical protein HDU86_005495 [Geranomyces michiganensis]
MRRPAFTAGTLAGSDPGIHIAFNAYYPSPAHATQQQPPTVILCAHALGMTKETFEPIIAALYTHPQVARAITAIYAFDARQQGASARLNAGTLPTDLTTHTDWNTNALDLLCLASHIHKVHGTATRIVGLGHSYGAVALTTATVIHRAQFHALLLCEPVLFTPDFFVVLTGNPEPFGNHMLHAGFVQTAIRKKGIFDSRQAAAREMRKKPFYAGFADECFELWLDHAFEYIELDDKPEAYALRCTPMTEASIFLGTGCTHPTFARLPELHIPTVVLTGTKSEWAQPIFAADGERGLIRDIVIASKVKHGKHYFVENASHMVAVEQPQAVDSVLFLPLDHPHLSADHMIELLKSIHFLGDDDARGDSREQAAHQHITSKL